jgi:hypothetical protein
MLTMHTFPLLAKQTCRHLSMKEGGLFCFVGTRSTKPRCFRLCSFLSLESSQQGGMHGLGSMTFWTCNGKVLEYWMISSLKIKLNCSWKFQRNWNLPLMLLERSWWARFNGIEFGMWGILILKWFLLLKIQINSKFWKEKSIENVVTLEGLPFNSSMISFHIWLLEKLIHTLQNNVHILSFPIL